MDLKKEDLQEILLNKRVFLDPDKKYTNNDLIMLLGECSLKEIYGSLDKVPWSVMYRFKMQSPMLSKSLKGAKPEKINAIIDNVNGEWVAEYKYNGANLIITYDPSEGFRFFTRHVSVVTWLPNEVTDKILLIKNNKIYSPSDFKNTYSSCFVLNGEALLSGSIDTSLFVKGGTVIESEHNAVSSLLNIEDISVCHAIQIEQSSLYFEIFDILYYNQDLRDYGFGKRKILLSNLINNLTRVLPFNDSVVFKDNFRTRFEDYLSKGGEGLILKNINKPYMSTTSRKLDVQVKWKKDVLTSVQQNEMSDIDCYISGYTLPKKKSYKDIEMNNLINGIKLSVILKRKDGVEVGHEIATVSNMPMDIRKDMTIIENDVVKLNPKYFGKVFVINGQSFTKRNLRFQHATCENWSGRVDKTQFDCIVYEQDLLNLTM